MKFRLNHTNACKQVTVRGHFVDDCSLKNEIKKITCRIRPSDTFAFKSTLSSLFHFVGSLVRLFCPLALAEKEKPTS